MFGDVKLEGRPTAREVSGPMQMYKNQSKMYIPATLGETRRLPTQRPPIQMHPAFLSVKPSGYFSRGIRTFFSRIPGDRT